MKTSRSARSQTTLSGAEQLALLPSHQRARAAALARRTLAPLPALDFSVGFQPVGIQPPADAHHIRVVDGVVAEWGPGIPPDVRLVLEVDAAAAVSRADRRGPLGSPNRARLVRVGSEQPPEPIPPAVRYPRSHFALPRLPGANTTAAITVRDAPFGAATLDIVIVDGQITRQSWRHTQPAAAVSIEVPYPVALDLLAGTVTVADARAFGRVEGDVADIATLTGTIECPEYRAGWHHLGDELEHLAAWGALAATTAYRGWLASLPTTCD